MENNLQKGSLPGYGIEELIPVVARLAKKYTDAKSSSITYECAEQLMEAVIYCIGEYEDSGETKMGEGDLSGMVDVQKLAAADAYQLGYKLVVEKAKAANKLYNEIMENFCDYGSRALYDTMAVGMPEFFLRYNARFAPQDELLMLDYPTHKPLGNLKGIDRIYYYLVCIKEEQEFLRCFPQGYVEEVCTAYHREYGELFINLSEIINLQ